MAQKTSGQASGAHTPRTVQDIQADIEATRDRLAGTVDEITTRAHPKNVAQRLKESAVGLVVDPETGPRYDRIAAAAGVVVLLVGVRVWRRRR